MQKVYKKIPFILISTLALIFQTGCSEKKQQTLIMGTSADYPPFEFQQAGQIVGMDIDVAEAIAEELGAQIEIQNMEFNSLIPALNVNRVDFVIAGMTATDQRSKNVAFSIAYYQPSFAILTLKDSSINSHQDLKNKKIGTQTGSTMEIVLKKQAIVMPSIDIISLPNNVTLVQELKVNRIDGVLIEEAQAKAFVKKNPALSYSIILDKNDSVAIAFPKNSKLVEPFNRAIKKLEESGKLEEIKNKWLN